ncbi:uncharacterized protein DUF4190 [Roseimicrobium gellanilyticum]|uniref:Uncharacterized protein DUF4190 n=1 Tax=Roseimicrobium gellanilyticum TaxID=748857 RepID=A0A366HL35_9BACT|nr:GYF domain-containing protein [Roseimicrobium gellanilyticum]RBP43643.1 uncharacterized protein DUF4190 [Roseimicrobium gellanilyticum]
MYYVGKNGQQTGPFTLEQVQAKYISGEILPTDLMWKEGTADWKAASAFSELAAPTPAPSPAYGAPGSSPVSLSKSDPAPTVLPPSSATPGAPNTGYPVAGPVGPRQNPMAITGLVLGIVSLFSWCCCFVGLPVSIAGIVFSIIGLNQIKKDPINQLGKPLAITGLVLSILGLLVLIVAVAINGVASYADIQRQLNEAR